MSHGAATRTGEVIDLQLATNFGGPSPAPDLMRFTVAQMEPQAMDVLSRTLRA